MSAQSIWDVLKIEATGDVGTIRKAYASRLKETNPETDGEGFKVLRAAYELALDRARHMAFREEQARADAAQQVPESDESETTVATQGPAEPDLQSASLDADEEDDFLQSSSTSDELSSPTDEENLAHQRACGALMAALNGGAEKDNVLGRLKDVLTGPAMNNLPTFHRTEIWLANVLMHCLPASEVLFSPLEAYFHWTPDERDWKRHAFLEPVFAWRAHLAAQNESKAFLARIRDRRHEFNRGYRMLSEPMEERNWLARTWCKRHTRTVRRLIEHISLRVPLAEQSLDREALAWWNEHLIVRDEPIYSFARFIGRSLAFGLVAVLAVTSIVYVADQFPVDRVAQLRQRSERAPQDRSLALELCSEATRAAPGTGQADPIAATQGGRTETQNRETVAQAVLDCTRALALIPESLMTLQWRAINYLKLEQWPEAIDDFRAILAISPNDPYALYGQGFAVRAQGESGRGMDLMAAALAVNPIVGYQLAEFKLADVPVAGVIQTTAPSLPSRAPRSDTPAKIVRHANQQDFDAAYQFFGISMTLEGKVELECLVSKSGAVSNCLIVSEQPWHTPMGEVAIKIAESMRGQPALFRRQPVDLAPVRISQTFQPPPEVDGGKAGVTAPVASNTAATPAARNPAAAPAAPKREVPPAPSNPVAAPAPIDPIAALRAGSERTPQSRPLAMELCRLATLDAPRLGGVDGVTATANGDAAEANRKKLELSIGDCGRALALAPESLLMRQRRAIGYLKVEKWSEALEDFRAISAVSPKDPVALFGQGLALRAQGDSAAGTDLMRSALAVDPTVQDYLTHFKLVAVPSAEVVAGTAPSEPGYPYPKADTPAKIVRPADQTKLDGILKYFDLRMTLAATVSVECLVDTAGTLSRCLIVSEKPFNTGMGEVAIKMAETAGAEPALLQGQPVDQAPVRYNFTFQLPPGR